MKRFFPVLLLISVVLVLLCGNAMAVTSGDFQYSPIYEDNTIKITGYTGDETDLVIPETIDGYTVSMLYAIYNSNVETLTIPNSVTEIDPGALSHVKDIHISDDHPTLMFKDGVLYNKERKSIIYYLSSNTAEHFDVPDGIKVIEKMLFPVRTLSPSPSLPAWNRLTMVLFRGEDG